MDAALDIASWVCLVGGSLFALIGALGVIRFPDVYTRIHAASLIETLGAGLILLGLIFQAGLTLISVKLVLVFIFMFFTNPTTTHALARAVIHAGIKPYVLTAKGKKKGKKK